MSFNWIAVEKIKEAAPTAHEYGWAGSEDEQQVRLHLDTFKDEVGKALCARETDIVFVRRNRTSYWVTRDDCPWAIGWIGYTDVRDNKVNGWTPTYCVHSWAITNDKYSWGNDNRHTKTSININTALKNAKTYLRRPSPIKLAGIKAGALKDGVRKEFDKLTKEVGTTAEKVVDIVTSIYNKKPNQNSRLYKELKHLLDMGHEFLDPEFESDVRAMVAADERLASQPSEGVTFYCVMAYESRGKMLFDVVKGTQDNPYSYELDQAYNRYTEDMLPEDLTRKLAVLQMLDTEDFVDGVGVSAGRGVFYVLAD